MPIGTAHPRNSYGFLRSPCWNNNPSPYVTRVNRLRQGRRGRGTIPGEVVADVLGFI